jgi:hypothetical protein
MKNSMGYLMKNSMLPYEELHGLLRQIALGLRARLRVLSEDEMIERNEREMRPLSAPRRRSAAARHFGLARTVRDLFQKGRAGWKGGME